MQNSWAIYLLLVSVRSQMTVRLNGIIDPQPNYPPFTFFEEGRDWQDLCTTNPLQSPIDISDSYSNLQIVTASNSTFREFQANTPPIPRSEGVFMQNAQGVRIYWLMSTTIEQEVLGQTIEQSMLEVHYMVPAEHTLNGLRYPLELHVVYALIQPEGSVVAGFNFILLFQEGKTDPFLDDLLNDNHTTIDLTPLFPIGGVVDDYYYYTGSVNMPWSDCWGPFSWVMPNYILEASPRQIQYFNDLYINDLSFSNGRGIIRALQPLNNRPIYHYIPPRDS